MAVVDQVTGVVLAGGKSKRMGQQKAGLLLDDEVLLQRVTGRLQHVFRTVIVIGPPTLAHLVPANVALIPDVHTDLGPLAGLEAALQAIHSEWVFVVACDMPFIEPGLVQVMAEYALTHHDADVVALARAGKPGVEHLEHLEHLHALYNVSALDAIRQQIKTGTYALHKLFAQLQVELFPAEQAASLDPQQLSAFNANTPEDWAQAVALNQREQTSDMS